MREIDQDECGRLLRLVRRGGGSVVILTADGLVLLSAHDD
jgi:hypothetical protein